MLTVATCLWAANQSSESFSRGYTPEWVDRLAASFRRNLTVAHRFVVLTDRHYYFAAGIAQARLHRLPPDYGSMIEPFRLEGPLIVVGLDTVVTGNIDHLAAWTLSADRMALPRSPGKPYACNGVALVPAGQRRIYDTWRGENDMAWLRAQPHAFIDDLWPGEVVSFKCDVRPNGLGDARIVYFHGEPKMADLTGEPWVRDHWR